MRTDLAIPLVIIIRPITSKPLRLIVTWSYGTRIFLCVDFHTENSAVVASGKAARCSSVGARYGCARDPHRSSGQPWRPDPVVIVYLHGTPMNSR